LLLDWMNTKYNGRRLPLSFYMQAYTTMFDHFIDCIKTRDTSLADLVGKEEFYRPLWTNVAVSVGGGNGNNNNGATGSGTGGRGGGGGGGSVPAHPDNSADVNSQIRRLQDQNQRTRQEMDRMRAQHARDLRSQPTSYPGASSNGMGKAGGANGGDRGHGNPRPSNSGGNGNNNDRSGGGGGGGGRSSGGDSKAPLKRRKGGRG
jgi:hypothetical protein